MAGDRYDFSMSGPHNIFVDDIFQQRQRYGYDEEVDDEFLQNRKAELYKNRITTPQTIHRPSVFPSSTAEDVILKRYVASSVSFVSLLAENILCHPFLVLRRQCQVHPYFPKEPSRYHLTPFTLIPSVYHLHQRQGLTTLWKGLGSVLLVRGISLGVEDLLSRITPWPDTISWHSSLKQFFQHIMLKCVSIALVTPFYAASFVETVQSEIASEKPGILDIFREGFIRLLSWNDRSKGRLIPIWALMLPTVTLGLAKYLFTIFMKGATEKVLQARMKHQVKMTGTIPKHSGEMYDISLAASLVSSIASDVIFYPCETVLYRLYLQGTRTIIDNLDNGSSVLAVLTNYKGATDCYEQCLSTEGFLGFYKGFGALIVQYALHIALVKITQFVFIEIGSMIRKPKTPPSNAKHDASPPALANISTMSKTYLLP